MRQIYRMFGAAIAAVMMSGAVVGLAFAQGASVLHEPKAEFKLLPAAECGIRALDRAFATLELSGLLIKRRLLAACLECMGHDRIVRIEEVELFRAIADALGCPVPPWLDLCRVYEEERKGGGGRV